MRFGKLTLAILLPVAALLASSSLRASAQNYNNWNYAIDAPDDGSGGSTYEMHGLAYRTVGSTLYFAISSQMPQAGNPVGGALNGGINYGELFLNFSGHNLDNVTKFTDPNVFAVRFDPNNDSLGNTTATPNHNTGLYANVTAVSLTLVNSGYGTLQDYFNAGFARSMDAMGDLENSNTDVTAYFSNGVMYPNIASGTRLGDITLLDRSQLSALDLDFGHFAGADPAGNNVFGFSLDGSLLPAGAFIAHNFEECINDGTALRGANVPEPGSVAMLISMGAVGAGFLTRRKTVKNAV